MQEPQRQARYLGLRAAAASGLVAIMMMLAACSSSGGPSTAASTGPVSSGQGPPSSASSEALSVTSTLDGLTTLPHRIKWIARPSRQTQISEVDFLIDGRQLWVEQNEPYSYGNDGNYLVTSFLQPGKHEFTVRAIGSDGPTATDRVTATVRTAPRPPPALAGTWAGSRQPEPGGAPGGTWHLNVSSVGWRIEEPESSGSGGNLVDVAYPSSGLVEIRTGMATGHDVMAGAPVDDDLNGWCNNEPGSPVRYRWSVEGTDLHLTFVGGDPCTGFTEFLTAHWTRP
jgi:hypothetical protein